jgi:septum site-determining protein MinC
MTESSARKTGPADSPFLLKAAQFMVPTLVIRHSEVDDLDGFLAEQVARMPAFFRQAPVAIDLTSLDEDDPFDAFPMVVGMLRGHGMIPVGVRGASAAQREHAQALELAILSNGGTSRETAAAPAKRGVQAARSLVVDKPVRSGQRVYARHADLILLDAVGFGAEVMADGHIHAYGPLRGRALAGVTGDEQAHIFCRELRAELVSIAGRYRISENLDERYIGKPVRIGLAGDRLDFDPL